MNNNENSKNTTGRYGKLIGFICSLIVVIFGGAFTWNNYFDADATNPSTTITSTTTDTQSTTKAIATQYVFRNDKLLQEHFQKHGSEFPYTSEKEYVAGANAVITNKAALHKKEAEDGDDCYYVEATNEYAVVSTDGYIRTYFKPDDGINYYNRK